MASLPMVASGDKGVMPTFESVCPTNNGRAYACLLYADVSKYNTLTLGKVYKSGNGNTTDTRFHIRNYISGGSGNTYSYTLSNSPQTFDISAFNELAIVCAFTSNTAWTSVKIDDFELS